MANPGAKKILEDAGVDYCCGGEKYLHEACMRSGVSAEEILRRLEEDGMAAGAAEANWPSARLGDLTRHVVEKHHQFRANAHESGSRREGFDFAEFCRGHFPDDALERTGSFPLTAMLGFLFVRMAYRWLLAAALLGAGASIWDTSGGIQGEYVQADNAYDAKAKFILKLLDAKQEQ